MQLVIDIAEEAYLLLKSTGIHKNDAGYFLNAVANGTLLPKGHGRLIDADELELDTDWDDYYDGYMAYSESMIKYAPTIIEADRKSD